MSTPISRIIDFFSASKKIDSSIPQRKSLGQVRTASKPMEWAALTEAFNNYGSGTTLKSLRVAAAFACNDRICKDIAQLPVRPTRSTSNGSEIAKDHDQYKLIAKNPSRLYTKYVWQYINNSNINIHGECFAPIKRKNGRPVEYGVWNPCDVEHDIKDGYITWVNKKTKEAVSDEDMIHVMWFTEDGIRGKSPLHYIKDTIDLALNGVKLGSELYKNQMWQPGYISYKTDLTQEVAEMIGKNWVGNFMGVENKMNIPVLDNDSKWMNFGMSLKDGEYTGTMENTAKEVARAMGVPGSKIGIRDGNVSYNSLEQENIAYVQDTILPRVISWEEELDRKALTLADQEDIRFKFEIKSRLRGDMAARSSFYDMALRNGLLSINDTLKLEDMDTIGPEGDERYVNAAQVPLSKLFSGELDQENEIAKLFQSKQNGHAHKTIKSPS